MSSTTPTQLGRYEVLDQLGRGAMGMVLLAKDPLIGRLVALKTLRLLRGAAAGDELDQFRRRFIREAQSAGILSHPNIVTIHDVVDESEAGGAAFIAMEYVRGTDLKQVIQEQGTLDLPVIVDVVRQVAAALDYAHAKGVIHRDVKPGNVLITGDGVVKLTDFGIARLNSSNLTLEHELLGTPNYMAPEQILGTETDHRADVFSLGVVLYEMLTGRKPFAGENLTAVSHNIVYEPYTPPAQHVSHLPAGIGALLDRALAKNPEERFATAGELARELAQVMAAYEQESSLNETRRLELAAPAPAVPAGARGSRLLNVLGRRPPMGRALAVAAVAAVASLLLGLWWVARLGGGQAVDSSALAQQERMRQYRAGMVKGGELLSAGDPVAAVAVLRQAERLAPGDPGARVLREQAELQVENLSEVERRVARFMGDAWTAIGAGRFEDAVRAADAALALDPDNEAAGELKARTEQLLADHRREEQRRRRTAAAASIPEPSAVPEADAPVAAEPPRETADAPALLASQLVSEHQDEPIGTFSVRLGPRQLFSHPFRFVERKGFLGLGREAYDGQLRVEPPLEIPPGDHLLLIHVTPRGKAARTESLDVRLEPGQRYLLSVFWSSAGELSARLE